MIYKLQFLIVLAGIKRVVSSLIVGNMENGIGSIAKIKEFYDSSHCRKMYLNEYMLHEKVIYVILIKDCK